MTRTEVCCRSKLSQMKSSSVTQPVAGTPPGTAFRASSMRDRAWAARLVTPACNSRGLRDVRDDAPFVEALEQGTGRCG